jgi:hypothetical protein
MKQVVLSGVTIGLIAASAYITASLTSTYVAAVRGALHGAGAAQWQYQFLLAPFPALLGVGALVSAWFVAGPLNAPLKMMAALATVVPVVLCVLVHFQIY